jgi:hypothetical protein
MKLKTSKTFSKGPRTKINNKKPKDVNQETNRKEDRPALLLGERERSKKKNKETTTGDKRSTKIYHAWHH